MSEIKVEYYQDEFSRSASIDGGTVNIRQKVSKFKIKSVRLLSTSSLPRTLGNARRYASVLTKAIEIAEKWDKDVGKDYKEVLGKAESGAGK